VIKLQDEILMILQSINENLEELNKKGNLPKLIYAKEIAENYQVNLNKATNLCKKYGTNFGGYCIEADKFKEVLQTKGIGIFS
jgi:hypothetical protein